MGTKRYLFSGKCDLRRCDISILADSDVENRNSLPDDHPLMEKVREFIGGFPKQ